VDSFKRKDSRIREKIASKYVRQRRSRIQHLLHNVTKRIVAEAIERRQAIVLENIEGIRRIYRGNGQGPKHSCYGQPFPAWTVEVRPFTSPARAARQSI